MENDTICIKRIDENLIDDCVSVYLEAFSQEPWNEKYEPERVENYFRDFMSGNICFGLALCEDNNVIGVLLGMIIPSADSDYARIEDFCIHPKMQSMGYGSKFLDLLKSYLSDSPVDCILLNTVRGFPSHKFYMKNGFTEIGTSVLLARNLCLLLS